MKKSCSFCGRIHDKGAACPLKPRSAVRKKKRDSQASRYRSTAAWTRLSLRIRERDHYICQACLHNLGSNKRMRIGEPVEVHHIDPLEENFEARDDENNLITLCKLHHEEAEAGGIDTTKLKRIARTNSREEQ